MPINKNDFSSQTIKRILTEQLTREDVLRESLLFGLLICLGSVCHSSLYICRLQNSLCSMSLLRCSVIEISMHDVGVCDARIKGSHTRRVVSLDSSVTHFRVTHQNFTDRTIEKREKKETDLESNISQGFFAKRVISK